MSLNPVAKTKVMSYLNKTPIVDLCYDYMVEFLGKGSYKVEDFIDYFISSIKQNLTKDKLPIKITKKMVVSIISMIDWYLEKTKTVNPDFENRINEIYLSYQNYLNKNPDLEDKELTEFIEELVIKASLLKIDKLENPDKSDNEIEKLTARLTELEQTIADNNRKLETLTSLKDDLQLKNSTKNFKIAELEKELKRLEKELNELREALEKCNYKNIDLTKKYNRVNKQLATLKARTSIVRQENAHLIRKTDALTGELERANFKIAMLQNELSRLKKIDAKQKLSDAQNTEIEEIILSYLCRQSYSANTLIKAILKKGYDITGEELFFHIKRLRQKYHIETANIEFGEPKYRLAKPPFSIGEVHTIILPHNTSYVDVLFTADYHICDLTNRFLDNYNMMLEYADSNNIYIIFNLGDFYDFNNGMGYTRSIDALKFMQEKHMQAMSDLPKSPILQTITGGNHDESVAYLGEDYLTDFVQNRSDFISLGYRYSKVILEKSSLSQIRLLLAHPHSSISKKFTRIYGLEFSDYDYSYLGHSHTAKIYPESKYAKVPSLIKDDNDAAGFLHVRFYFDSKGLDNMEVKPLTLERKIVKGTTIHYSSR